MQNEVIGTTHHQLTDKGYDYVAFEVRCGVCRMLLFEFVHKQKYLSSQERLLAIPDPNPPAETLSWYKPAVKVICNENGSYHGFVPVGDGEDRNQVITSRQMNFGEFRKWIEGVSR